MSNKFPNALVLARLYHGMPKLSPFSINTLTVKPFTKDTACDELTYSTNVTKLLNVVDHQHLMCHHAAEYDDARKVQLMLVRTLRRFKC